MFGCTGADAVIQRHETSRQRLQQLEQLRIDLESRYPLLALTFTGNRFYLRTRTEALGKRRVDLQNLLNGLRIGVVSASSEESREGLDEDAQELARFSKVIDDMPMRVSPNEERLNVAASTIARLQPTVARFDVLFLQVLILRPLWFVILDTIVSDTCCSCGIGSIRWRLSWMFHCSRPRNYLTFGATTGLYASAFVCICSGLCTRACFGQCSIIHHKSDSSLSASHSSLIGWCI
jgi:hypothetical protein